MGSSLDRRRFLGSSAAAAAGMTLASQVAHATANTSKANRPIVVGVMGQQRGLALAKTFATTPNVIVKYACDIDSERAEKGAKTINKLKDRTMEKDTVAIGDYKQILKDPEIDALVCAAPNHWHGPATIEACAAGKHVYVEKPCSHNAAEGELMIEAARKHNRVVQMGTQRRSSPPLIEVMKQIHEGLIGRVYSGRSFYSNARPSIGNGMSAPVPENIDYELWQGPAPRKPYLDNVVHYNWHWRWHWGNGELGNNGIHSLDLCRWAMDVDYPTRVVSSGDRYRYNDDQETADTHVVAFEFGDKGQLTWQCLSNNRHKFPFAIVFGENGTVEFDSKGGYKHFDVRDKLVKEVEHPNGQTEHIANFVDAIRAESPSTLNQDIESGHKSTLLCHLGNISHHTGETINCDPKNGHIIGNDEAIAKHWGRDYEPGWEPKV